MVAPLMPKATAVWLIENTALTFDQPNAVFALGDKKKSRPGGRLQFNREASKGLDYVQ